MSNNDFDDTELAKWDPSFIALARKVVSPIAKLWFRAEVRGLDRLPPAGGALVVAPDEQDQTQGIVVARVYYASGDQKVKPASSQLTMSWNVPFILPE